MPQLVFVSLFLALISGTQPVELKSTPEVASVSVEIDGVEVARMLQPPWRTTVDFGEDIEPHQLVAVGRDLQGDEIARASQYVNLRRPMADVQIAVQYAKERPTAVTLIGRHRMLTPPEKAVVRVDGRKVPVAGLTATLPTLDPSKPHIVDAMLQFEDRTVARSELVLEGGFSDSTGTQMTPIALTRVSAPQVLSLEGCFSWGGTKLRASPVEVPQSLIVIVQDPDPSEANFLFLPPNTASTQRKNDAYRMRKSLAIPYQTLARIVWPITTEKVVPGEGTTSYFNNLAEENIGFRGLLGLLTLPYTPLNLPADAAVRVGDAEPRRIADAVAVAGVIAIEKPRRRAVIAVLDDRVDESDHVPASVRHYLKSIGVPLFVWSLRPPDAERLADWGDVIDISTPKGVEEAMNRLRESLASQSIVWLAADPLVALRAKVDERCGVAPLAGR